MVSFIVPIYNVENYVKKCLDSLAAQTLKDVEFILIDDGSTDNSGKIAEQYCSDSRFHILHTENRGLSAARNYGIDQSHGEYLMFVDGDDWIAPDFSRIPYETAIKNNADLVIFRAFRAKNGKIRNKNRAAKNIPKGIVGNYTAIKYGGNAAWNKLYKRELFNNIRYPEGHVYEEIATTHKLIHIAKKICMIKTPLYYHVYRKNSISHSLTSSSLDDFFISNIEKYKNMISFGYPLEEQRPILWSSAITYLINKRPCKEEKYIQATQIVESIIGIPRQILLKHKVALMAWRKNKKLFNLLCKVAGRLRIS